MHYHEYGSQSLTCLTDCHPKLIYLAFEVLRNCDHDIGIHCGIRTEQEQSELVHIGASWTMDSKHRARSFPGILKPVSGAIDFHVYAGGSNHFSLAALTLVVDEVWKPQAERLSIPIICGADWRGKKRDACHIELAEKSKLYPAQ